MKISHGAFSALATPVILGCIQIATLVPCAAEAIEVVANPMQQVVELLEVLAKEVEIEAKRDATAYEKYSGWYGNETKRSTLIIMETGDKIAQLESDLQEAEAFRKEKERELVELANHNAKNSAQLTDGRKEFKKETEKFMKYDTELSESLEQLDLSIEILEKKMPQTSAAASSASLLSVAMKLKSTLLEKSDFALSNSQREIVDGFLEYARLRDSENSDSAKQKTSQETSFFQLKSHLRSHAKGEFKPKDQLLSTLMSIRDKVSTERDHARKDFAETKGLFHEWASGLEIILEDQKKSMADAKKSIAVSAETSSQQQASLLETQSIHKSEVEYLQEVETEFRQKTQSYKTRLRQRMDEAVAIHEAQRVMAHEFTKDLIKRQTIGTIDFLQEKQRVQHKALEVMKRSPTPGLAALALSSSLNFRHGARNDPFGKVKEMIKSMLARLLATQSADAKKHEWCDKEMSATTKDQERKGEEILKMGNRLEALTAELNETNEEIVTLTADFAQLNASVVTATEIRAEERAREMKNIKESKNAIELLKKAVAVLKAYFNKKVEKDQEERGDGFKQRAGLASGIIGLLEIAISDFEKQLEEAEQAEEISARDFEEFKSESGVRIAVFQKQLEYTDRRRVKLEYDEVNMNNDLKSYEKESLALDEYMDKLKAQCIVQGPSYDEKQAKIQEQLKNLKEALAYLMQ